MKNLIFTLCALTGLGVQAQTFEWVQAIGASASLAEMVQDVELVPGSNGVVAVGNFGGTQDFDPGAGVVSFTASGQDGYVIRLDENNNLLWAYQIGSSGSETPAAVAVNANGDVFITGTYTSAMDFDAGPGVSTLTPVGFSDIFILKLNASGQFQWAKSIGGLSVDAVGGIAIGLGGSIIVYGTFEGSIDLDPSSGTDLRMSNGSSDIFICGLTSSGDLSWGGNFGGGSYDFANAIAMDSQNNIYITGSFQGTTDLDPGASSNIFTSAGSSDIFLSKFSETGYYLWTDVLGGTGSDAGNALTVLGNGNVLLGGKYSGVADFDPSGGTFNLTAYQGEDGFVAEYMPSGGMVNAWSLEGLNDQSVRALATDDLGNIYLLGQLSGEMDLDPGPGSFALQNLNGQDIFFAKWSGMGELRWGHGYFGGYADFARSLAVNSATNEMYLCGNFTGTVDFDFGPSTYNLTADANGDGFLMKMQCPAENTVLNVGACGDSYQLNNETYTTSGTYQQILTSVGGCDSILTLNLTFQNSSSTQVLTVCDPTYPSPSGNYFWSTTGIYYDTIPNALGCDSVITFDLTFVQVDASVNITGSGLVANATGASFQWIDCNSGQPIPGATSATYVPTYNGDFAVEVTINGCTETSPCTTINNVGLGENDPVQVFLYPNPATSQLHILCTAGMEALGLYDLSGKLCVSFTMASATSYTLQTEGLDTGTYVLEVQSPGRTERMRVVIQH